MMPCMCGNTHHLCAKCGHFFRRVEVDCHGSPQFCAGCDSPNNRELRRDSLGILASQVAAARLDFDLGIFSYAEIVAHLQSVLHEMAHAPYAR